MTPWGAIEQILDKRGWTLQTAGGSCPFQLEATHEPSNSALYFRARGQHASLDIGTNLGLDKEQYFYRIDEEFAEAIRSWKYPWAGYVIEDPDVLSLAFWMLFSEAIEQGMV